MPLNCRVIVARYTRMINRHKKRELTKQREIESGLNIKLLRKKNVPKRGK